MGRLGTDPNNILVSTDCNKVQKWNMLTQELGEEVFFDSGEGKIRCAYTDS